MTRFLLTLFCLIFSHPALVQGQTYTIQNVARLDMLPGYPTPTGQMIAARIRLKPGWKTYWRAPGGNGIPPLFNWTGSQNIGAVRYYWPAPDVFVEGGVTTIGYERELILPIAITPRQPGEPLALRGEVVFGICDDICIPVKARFSLNVTGRTAQNQKAIKSALRQQPKSARAAGIRSVSCRITPIPDGFRIEATIKGRASFAPGTFSVFEFPHPEVWVESGKSTVSGSTFQSSANLYAYGDTPLILDRSKIRVTLLGGPKAVELRGCPAGR